MMRRIVTALLVCALVFSFSAPAFADGERVSVSYYSIDMNQTFFDNTVSTMTVDLMIYPTKNEIYINAEDLGYLSCYDFKLSEEDCAYSDESRGHLVYYKFNTKKMLVYYSGQPVTHKMPYAAKYVDGVAWVPLDFGMKMLNMNYTITEDGAACCVPYETVFSVAHRILQGEFKFDYATDLGYSDLAMMGLETGAFLANLFSGIVAMEGSCWGTLITSIFGNKDLYDGMMAESVCDLFVMPAQNEVAEKVKGIYQFPLNGIKANSAINDGFDIYYEVISLKNENIAKNNKKLLKNADKLNAEIKNITGKNSLSSITSNFSVGWEDAVGCLIDLAAMKLQFENRDEVAARALKLYGEKSSSNVAGTVRSYARDVNINSDMQGAFSRYLKENWDNILLGSINLGPAALVSIGWSVVSSSFPYISNSLKSTESFSCAQQAAAMQNDAFWILSDDYNEALSSKKLKEGSLEDVAAGCYTYLKFSLIARECAMASVKSSPEIDAATKTAVTSRLQKRNDAIAEMLTVVSCVEKGNVTGVNNDNGVYGLLLPSENAAYRSSLDDSPVIKAVTEKIGTLIAHSTQEAQPEENVVLTEEQAIEMVRNAMNKYTMGLLDLEELEGLYTYECIDLCDAYIIDLTADGILDNTAQFETDYCYIIAHYTAGSPDGLFCVAADGTGAYICAEYGDMEYAFLQEFNLADLSMKDLVEVMKQFSGLMLEEMLKEYGATTQTTTP